MLRGVRLWPIRTQAHHNTINVRGARNALNYITECAVTVVFLGVMRWGLCLKLNSELDKRPVSID